MSEYIPDPIELMEMQAERAYFEGIQPNGLFKCSCGELFDPEREGGTTSAHPSAMPVCPKCYEEHFKYLTP